MEDKNIKFPKNFPDEKTMLNVLKKTIEKSWKIDMDIEDINRWLGNFTGKCYEVSIERRLALWMLCNFTYYNEEEIKYLCGLLFRKFVHHLIIDNKLTSSDDAEKCILETGFTSIGRASESGGLILYHFRQEAKLDLKRFIFPTDMDTTEYDQIVCVDDVIISGGTAQRFFHNNIDKIKDKKLYYISLFASETAIRKLEELGVTVICCLKLDNRNKMFSDESLAFYKYSDVKQYAYKLAKTYGEIIESKKPLGHKSGQYYFGMYYNVPNNSLPIFWSNNNWIPIFERKEKYQNEKEAKREYGYFI